MIDATRINAASHALELDAAASPPALGYLECRVREEAKAAAQASSIEATLAHLVLATRYAERFGEYAGRSASPKDRSWVEDQRIW